MLSVEENKRLTRVGPGTPMGQLLRWYWHPIAATIQLKENPVRKVRILGEDLVLYRDRSGHFGLIGDRCAHRATGLWFGIPDADGLRCCYHGWKYDATGQCIDQPLEPPGSNFKLTIKIKGYPVQEMGGLIWAYLGEPPVPLLPRWDQFVRGDVFRLGIAATTLPCNWLQCLENGGDPNHGNYLHARRKARGGGAQLGQGHPRPTDQEGDRDTGHALGGGPGQVGEGERLRRRLDGAQVVEQPGAGEGAQLPQGRRPAPEDPPARPRPPSCAPRCMRRTSRARPGRRHVPRARDRQACNSRYAACLRRLLYALRRARGVPCPRRRPYR